MNNKAINFINLIGNPGNFTPFPVDLDPPPPPTPPPPPPITGPTGPTGGGTGPTVAELQRTVDNLRKEIDKAQLALGSAQRELARLTQKNRSLTRNIEVLEVQEERAMRFLARAIRSGNYSERKIYERRLSKIQADLARFRQTQVEIAERNRVLQRTIAESQSALNQLRPELGRAEAALSLAQLAGSRLGMDVGPARFDVFGIGDGAIAKGSGFGVRDTTGVTQPGALTPNSRSTIAGIGVRGSFDASRWLNLDGDQSLVANGFVSYSRVVSKSGNSTALAAVGLTNAGTGRANNVTVGGSIRYDFAGVYLRGAGAYNVGRHSTSNTVDNSHGKFDSRWYNIDFALGKTVPLAYGGVGSNVHPGLFTKGPLPLTNRYMIGLDLRGHIGHTELRTDAFTDSTGFIYGASGTRHETVGGRAELFAHGISGDISWRPYAAVRVDHQFNYSSSVTFPVQPNLPNGNTVHFDPANTFWGPELGLTIAGQQWWNVQARGYYLASADSNVTGGSLQVRIPFNP